MSDDLPNRGLCDCPPDTRGDACNGTCKPRPVIASPPDDLTLAAVIAEVLRARTKFPGNKHLLAALVEEVGELAQAMLQDKPRDQIEREAIQVACVAVRLIEEGDAAFDAKDWSIG